MPFENSIKIHPMVDKNGFENDGAEYRGHQRGSVAASCPVSLFFYFLYTRLFILSLSGCPEHMYLKVSTTMTMRKVSFQQNICTIAIGYQCAAGTHRFH